MRAARLGLVACVLAASVLLAGMASTAWAQQQASERRIALVIGIGAYQSAPQLANPVRDARAVAAVLRQLNFEVTELYDPDNRTLTRGIRDMGLRAQQADVALVYYAGHGVQVGRENYLLPIDARLERQRDVVYEALPLELLLGEASQARKVSIVLLDACRNNPFVERVARSMPGNARGIVSAGLARVDNVPRNTVVAMSTRADETAEDGAGEHSPFATALLNTLATPGLELSLFFRTVRDAVLKDTDGRQEPYVFSSVGAEPFYFNPLPPNRPPVVEAARRVRMYTGPIGITRPTDPDGDALTVLIKTVPRGQVRDGRRTIRPGDRLTAEALADLAFVPEPDFVGNAGLLSYQVEDGRGGVADSAVELDVVDASEAGSQLAEASLWDKLRAGGQVEDLDLFLRLYPRSRFAGAVAQRRAELTRAAPPTQLAALPPPAVPPASPPPPVAQAPQPAPAPSFEQASVAHAPIPQRGMASTPSPGSPFRDCESCPTMILLQGGNFVMGQGSSDPAAQPPHRVTLGPFALQQTPVTVADWKACQAGGGCGPLPRMAVADDDTPLHNASWDDAQQYITWLSRVSGRSYRLPSEAEWEFAARAGTTTRFSWGDKPGIALANCADCGGAQDHRAPAPVREFQPNPLGLYGMAGGVSQWVQDCWSPNYVGARADGTARESKGCQQRVLRGGSFRSTHDDIAPAARNRYDAPVRYFTNGFRVARNAEG